MEIEIVLLKYDEQFTKRSKDIKRMTWFSFPNDLMTHPDFFDVTGDEFKAFMWCVSVCSKCNSSKIRMNVDHACHFLKMKPAAFHSMIEKLKGKQLDVVRDQGATASGQNVASTEQDKTDKTQQDTQDKTHTTGHPEPDQSGVRGCLDVFVHDPVCFEMFGTVTRTAQHSWREAYPNDQFIIQECRRAKAWIASNPQKAPKNFQRFFANWLSRAFESYRKGLPSRRQTTSETNAAALTDLFNKVERGEA